MPANDDLRSILKNPRAGGDRVDLGTSGGRQDSDERRTRLYVARLCVCYAGSSLFVTEATGIATHACFARAAN